MKTRRHRRRTPRTEPTAVNDTKLRIILDEETRPLWETAKRAAAEVASWPAWKRNEQPGERDAQERQWHETWADCTPEPRR